MCHIFYYTSFVDDSASFKLTSLPKKNSFETCRPCVSVLYQSIEVAIKQIKERHSSLFVVKYAESVLAEPSEEELIHASFKEASALTKRAFLIDSRKG